ncbi:TPA: transcriptional regulator FeaR [Escherichia coli]|uniref:transcriptional regulator FeaR n=1 Tax=Escherichia coli TaxID=562 RepID=UPI002B2D611C|nr:transcriptional regulator FeaR [Escherichia coli]BEA49951.1 transcriptional activator FeaR [Escherichia coli]
MNPAVDNEFQQWLSQINQVCGNFTGRLLTERYTGVLDTHFVKGLKLSTVTTSGVNLSRTWQEVKGSDDAWFYTVFQLSGQAIMEQDERQVQIGAGDITLLDASRPCSLYWQESSKQISLLLPRTLLEQYFPHQKPVCAERLDADLPMVQLSHRLLQESMNNPALSETESEAALQAMVCLLRPVLHQRESVQPRRERQFQKVVTLIDDNIREEILRPEWIAGETGMSVRSLYRMFADKGLVVAQYIRNRRLDFCADAIRHAADDEKLAGIGFHWGFSDQSHFSTVFKQRFGMTPGEYRRKFR